MSENQTPSTGRPIAGFSIMPLEVCRLSEGTQFSTSKVSLRSLSGCMHNHINSTYVPAFEVGVYALLLKVLLSRSLRLPVFNDRLSGVKY